MKKYLWIKMDENFISAMEEHEVVTSLSVCNWHECEYSDNWVRVTIDWGKSGERNKKVGSDSWWKKIVEKVRG